MFAFFKDLTVADYAKLAFGGEKTGNPSPTFKGGVFAGKGTPWERRSAFETPAPARLVEVRPGKVFVRWANSVPAANAPKTPTWAAAASGPWWLSDGLADLVVRRTVASSTADSDTSMEARKFAAVAFDWSDMKKVVVCQLEQAVRVLVGVGRPVSTVQPETARVMTFLDRDLQYILLTTDENRAFHGDKFLSNLFCGSSKEFTQWWLDAAIVKRRRGRA